MKLVKLMYANGTHFCDADRVQPGFNDEPLKLVIVTPAGNIHYQHGFRRESLPDTVNAEVEMLAGTLKAKFNTEWLKKSIVEKYEIMLEFFKKKPFIYHLPLTEDKWHCDRGHFAFSYDYWINKYLNWYINEV